MNDHPTTPNAAPAHAPKPDRAPGGRAVDTAVAGAHADADDARRADALADALDRLAHHGFTDGGGMAHHAPMGAEALSALGYHDQVASWVDVYNQRHDPMGAPGADHPLTPGDDTEVAAALGDPSRLGDWAALFDHLLHEQLWPDVVRAWVPRLLPGYGGAFTHGLLRTAHAVRTIDAVGSTPAARRELARALAWWAGTYTELPGRPGLAGTLTLDEAIGALPRPATPWSPEDAGRFVHLHELDGFAGAVDELGAPRDPDLALGELTATYARMLVAHPEVHPFALLHAITPVAAARTLVPFVPGGSAVVYRHLWHVDAAIAASFLPPGAGAVPAEEVDISGAPTPDELAARAADHGDVHVVKFTEACLREHARQPDPAYLAAAARLVDVMPPW